MENDNEKNHQLHITIPGPLYKEVKNIVPDYGAVSSLVRNLLKRFVYIYNNSKGIGRSPFDEAVDGMVEDVNKKKGAIDGTE